MRKVTMWSRTHAFSFSSLAHFNKWVRAGGGGREDEEKYVKLEGCGEAEEVGNGGGKERSAR